MAVDKVPPGFKQNDLLKIASERKAAAIKDDGAEVLDKKAFTENSHFFERIFKLSDNLEKYTEKMKLQEKAKELGINQNDFRKIYELQRSAYNNKIKSADSNKTQFTDQLFELNCGIWHANDFGVWRTSNKEYEEHIKIYACPHPIMVTGTYTNIQDGTEKTKLSFYKHGKWQNLTVGKTDIADRKKIVNLADLGIEVTSESAKELINYLSELCALNIGILPHSESSRKMGWIESSGKEYFLPYTDKVQFDGSSDFFGIHNALKPKGSYNSWVDTTLELINRNAVFRLVVASSFASPLIEKIGGLPFIVHLWGGTEAGKTVSQMVGASVWGNPKIGKFLFSLKNTNVGFEVTSNFLNNLPMYCDELQELKHFPLYRNGYDPLIMSLGSGQGKGRGNKSGGIQAMNSWTNCFIFSGEDPITSDNMGGGAKNRVIEIETVEKLVFDAIDGNKIATFYSDNYGLAGEKYVEILNEFDFSELKKIYIQNLSELTNYTTDKQAMAMGMLLLGDYMMSKYIFGINPLVVSDVKNYVGSKKSVNIYERAYEWVLSYIDINRIRFEVDSDINKGEIWGKINDKETICYFNKKVLEKKMQEEGYNYRAVSKKWIEYGYINRAKDGKFTIVRKINGNCDRYVEINLKPKDELELEEINVSLPDEFIT